MAGYESLGYETSQGCTLEPGSLEGAFQGTPWLNIGGEAQAYSHTSHRILLQGSQVPVSTSGLFQVLKCL